MFIEYGVILCDAMCKCFTCAKNDFDQLSLLHETTLAVFVQLAYFSMVFTYEAGFHTLPIGRPWRLLEKEIFTGRVLYLMPNQHSTRVKIARHQSRKS